jgi:hypothetical protein
MNEYEEFCIKEANYHLNRAREILTVDIKNPKQFYDETTEHYRNLAKLFPFMYLITQQECNELRDHDDQSLSDTQSSVSSASDSFVPATP